MCIYIACTDSHVRVRAIACEPDVVGICLGRLAYCSDLGLWRRVRASFDITEAEASFADHFARADPTDCYKFVAPLSACL